MIFVSIITYISIIYWVLNKAFGTTTPTNLPPVGIQEPELMVPIKIEQAQLIIPVKETASSYDGIESAW